MVNVGERRVVCCGGDHVRFLGLGHMVNDVVENGKNRNKKSNCSNMIVLCEDLLLLLFVDNVIELCVCGIYGGSAWWG